MEINNKVVAWFFAGGETDDNKFNVFTGSFIRIMKKIMDHNFEYVKGIYFRTPMMNVIWALNNSQKPVPDPGKSRIIDSACKQIIQSLSTDNQLILLSSSTGSAVAAQVACHLAKKIMVNNYPGKSFHLALGATIISKESELYKRLERYREGGIIGSLIYDDLQDEGDNSTGVSGRSRREAYNNAFGLILPFLSQKFHGPSFLNINPETGHLHRRRSQTVKKAIDYVEVLLIKHKLAGDLFCEKAKIVIEEENKLYS